MKLSEDDAHEIAGEHGELATPYEIALMGSAFALGVERARVVKALEWREPEHMPGELGCWRESKERASGKRYSIHRTVENGYEVYDAHGHIGDYSSLDAAKAACQAHHAARVLSMLEKPE